MEPYNNNIRKKTEIIKYRKETTMTIKEGLEQDNNNKGERIIITMRGRMEPDNNDKRKQQQ